MDAVLELLRDFCPVKGKQLHLAGSSNRYVAINPSRLAIEAEASSRLVVVHTDPTVATIDIVLAEGAELDLMELFLAEAFSGITLHQQAHSRCRMTAVELSSSNAAYTVNLDGEDAENQFGGVFLVGGAEHSVLHLRTNHNVAECRSNSYIKGVAGGSAVGVFSGLVYVAPDAQRTDARQSSRNILLSDTARIDTKPQLEIYADDVKCSHGATVGQMDNDAILYMRQRGLSEEQARRLQIEGFVADVVLHCGIEELCEPLMALATQKMEKM